MLKTDKLQEGMQVHVFKVDGRPVRQNGVITEVYPSAFEVRLDGTHKLISVWTDKREFDSYEIIKQEEY